MNKTIEERLIDIETRNARVEKDKAWETSWTRRITITFMTYMVVTAYLLFINDEKPFISAAVPAVGFLLSTLLLRQIRDIWGK